MSANGIPSIRYLQAMKRCPGLSGVLLERCSGPGPVLHCGCCRPNSVAVLDTPLSPQLVEQLASACPDMDNCQVWPGATTPTENTFHHFGNTQD